MGVLGLFFNSSSVRCARKLIPNNLVNSLWHKPKSIVAAIAYGFPARKIKTIAVTGTKGKTSTAHLIYHILLKNGKKTALISTIAAKFQDQEIDTGLHVTNPDPFILQKLIKKAVGEKFEYLVLEVTSHGLAQYRNWGIPIEIGVFTNIYSDHVEYHGGLQQYKAAKSKLIGASKQIILNFHDPSLNFLKQIAKKKKIPFTLYRGESDDFDSQNRQAAILTVEKLGMTRNQAQRALKSFPGVIGRMEEIQSEPFSVIIDFAHTPDSLKAALLKLRPRVEKSGRLIAVFGCAGDRDPGRRKMGEVAAIYSDIFIITAEDPRDEGVDKISKQIIDYAVKAGAKQVDQVDQLKGKDKVFLRIDDRTEAVKNAIYLAQPGDVIGFFGKGHEKSICFGKVEHPWSEHEVIKQALEERL